MYTWRLGEATCRWRVLPSGQFSHTHEGVWAAVSGGQVQGRGVDNTVDGILAELYKPLAYLVNDISPKELGEMVQIYISYLHRCPENTGQRLHCPETIFKDFNSTMPPIWIHELLLALGRTCLNERRGPLQAGLVELQDEEVELVWSKGILLRENIIRPPVIAKKNNRKRKKTPAN